MICEVQLILNQYLHEKKRLHKLYSILRDRAFFEMVTKQDADEEEETGLDIKKLQFEPVLNLQSQVDLSNSTLFFYKCSVEPDLKLLGMNCGRWSTDFLCVDMSTKKEIFKFGAFGDQSHHWVQHQKHRYLSLQTNKTTIKMFQIDEETKAFTEDESLTVSTGEDDEINAIEFDRTFKHIFILKNLVEFEKRVVGSSDVISSVKLEEKVHVGATKAVAISEDGSLAAIRGGAQNPHFYLVDLLTNAQHKFKTNALSDGTLSPCFINGGTTHRDLGHCKQAASQVAGNWSG